MFQFTPLREGRPAQAERRGGRAGFNSRPCARGDRVSRAKCESCQSFNSRPCARGDCHARLYAVSEYVSIHAPARGATISGSAGTELLLFQFTPLREGRPTVSAPTVKRLMFQFTPLREGRRAETEAAVRAFQFQFTPLREGRLLR